MEHTDTAPLICWFDQLSAEARDLIAHVGEEHARRLVTKRFVELVQDDRERSRF